MIKVDIKGAEKKVKTLYNLDKAVMRQLTAFGGKVQKHIIRAVSGRILKTRTGHLSRNIGMTMRSISGMWELSIGTGIGGKRKVKYARIQEKGKRRQVPSTKQYLTIPIHGTKGRTRNFKDAFFLKDKQGRLFLVQREGGKLKFLFVLRKSVRIPSSRWLSLPVNEKIPLLKAMMEKKELIKVAERI